MTRKDPRVVGLAELEAALDTYGADRTRWPAPLRHALSGLIAGNTNAQKVLKRAEVFDRLLDSAPRYEAHKLDRLADRIVAAAEGQSRVVSFKRPRRPAYFGSREYGFAAAALAASLLIGVVVGQSNVVGPAAEIFDSASSLSAAGTNTQMALSDDADSLLEEDLL